MKDLTLDDILRYGLAGAVAILAAVAGYDEPYEWLLEHKEKPLVAAGLSGLAVTIGALTYVLYRAVFLFLINLILSQFIGPKIGMIEIDIRRMKNRLKKHALQPALTQWASQGHFLYSSCLAVVFANSVAYCATWAQSKLYCLQLWFIPVLLVGGFIHHVRYLRREEKVFRHDEKLW